MLRTVFKSKPHFDDAFFAWAESAENMGSLPFQIYADQGFGGCPPCRIMKEITQTRIFFLPYRSFERDRLLRDLQRLTNFYCWNVQAGREFFGGRLTAEFLYKLTRCPEQFVDDLGHVYRDADPGCLVGNGPGNRLAYPRGCIG